MQKTLLDAMLMLRYWDDQDPAAVDLVEQLAAIEDVREMVDSAQLVIQQMTAQLTIIKARKEKLDKIQKAIDKIMAPVKEDLIKAMEAGETSFLEGHEYSVAMQGAAIVNLVRAIPTDEDVKKYPEFVKVKTEHRWSKTAIGKALKLGNSAAHEIAAEGKSLFVKFSSKIG